MMSVASMLVVLACGAAGLSPISAAKGPYFFCDDRVVADRWGVERFVVQPERHPANPLITRKFPWEGTGPHMGGTVLFDPGDKKFKMWYSVWNKHAYYNNLPFSYNVCYAESDDGIGWRRPFLGVFDYESSSDNNCIKLGTDKTQNIDVCLNPRPDAFPGKFIAIHNQKGGVFVSSSDDGYTFTRLVETPAIAYHSDTHNNWVYDEIQSRWLLYCRPELYAGDHKRRVSLQESEDLARWTPERTILVPTETDKPEFYGMTVFRRGDLFFGMLQVYDRATGLLYPELRWSGDGEHWTCIPTHPPFVQPGPEGAWDAGMILLAESPVVVDDEMRFYYGGFPLPHDTQEENVGAIGLLTAERDRLIGVRSVSDEPGFVLTRAFDPRGKRLLVNAKIAGELRAELRGARNKPLEGWSFSQSSTITESGFAKEIIWQGQSLGDCPEEAVAICFQLRGAELFTFEFAD